jgi:hypothetical protein
VEIFRPILSPVTRYGSVSDTEVEDAIDDFEMRLLIERVRACSGCAGDYEDPERTAWEREGDEVDLLDDREDREDRNDRVDTDDRGDGTEVA